MVEKNKLKEFGKWVDKIIDWKKITGKPILGAILESLDNWGIPQLLDYLNVLGDKIPKKFQDNINDVIDACIAENYENILKTIPDLQQDLFNIKALNDELETKFVAVNLEAIVEIIKYYAEKNRK